MTTTTTIPSNYDQNQVNIISHSNNNNNTSNNITGNDNKTNHVNNYQSHNSENTNILLTNNQNPNNIVNGYLYNPNYVFGGGVGTATATAPGGEV